MRLKKLTLIGFKSFAKKVILDFDLPITAIVGPNGCGKSNIVDAFRWVMGEQSARQLRGEKMHDLLFAGSSNMKPSNYAEVAITLTEIDGKLPIEYDEVTISRRLYRNGQSEYLINKNPVRLKSIQTLLMGSGVGKNAFSIFEQGKLDAVISLPPTERRSIFDEVAGTSRFLFKKKESLKKLDQVEVNLDRVKDVYEEVKKQTRILSRQAAAAKSYQANEERLTLCQKSLLGRRYRTIAQKKGALETKFGSLKKEAAVFVSAVECLQKHLHKISQSLVEVEDARKKHQEKIYQNRSQIQILSLESDQEKRELTKNRERKKHLEKELGLLHTTLEEKESEYSQAKEVLKIAHEKMQRQENEAKEHQTAVKKLEEKLALLQRESKILTKQHLDRLREENELSSALQEKNFKLKMALEAATKVSLRQEKFAHDKNELSLHIEDKKQRVDALKEAVQTLKVEIDESQERIHINVKQNDELNVIFNALVQTITEKNTRLQTLSRLQEEMEGFSCGAKTLLSESKKSSSPLFGKIKEFASLISFPKEYEKVCASALRFYAHTLVVETDVEWKLAVDYAKTHQLTDFSLLSLEHCQKPSPKTALTKTPLLAHLLGHLELVEDLRNPSEINKDGAFFNSRAVFFSEKGEVTLFQRYKELALLEEEISHFQSEKIRIEKQRKTLLQTKQKEESALGALQETMRWKEINHVQENFSLQRAISDRAKLDEEERNLQQEQSQLQDKIKTYKQSNLELTKQLEEVHKLTGKTESIFSKVEKEVEGLHTTLQRARESKEIQNKVFTDSLSRFEKQESLTNLIVTKIDQEKSHKKRICEEELSLDHSIEKAQKNLSAAQENLLELKNHLLDLEETISSQEEDFRKMKREQAKVSKELEMQRGLLKEEENRATQVEIELAKQSSLKEEMERELLERFSCVFEDLQEENEVTHLSDEEIQRECVKLKVALEKSGSINMTSIEEYQSQEKRFVFLQKQLRDLETTKKDLEKIITSLDSECRKIFRKTFEAVKKSFQKNFQILFGGGEADLKFTDSSDILAAGIEIVAKPPGKQMRAISLLSGGEKCLTALSLLFAIFEVKPAPFCILDEVDAPLDDSNIDRFTNVLQQFITSTQFVIVTHNKKTMTISDRLFGVSMEERGVSTLISLSLAKSHKNSSVSLQSS